MKSLCRFLFFVGFAYIVCLPACAADKSCHDAKLEAAEPAAMVYALSPFVHGYRDGYQQGFHDADIDLQFAHEEVAAESMKGYREVRFRKEFGDKQSYVPGFRAGYIAGAADMRAGREFEVFSMLRHAMAGSTGTLNADPKSFNQGAMAGYSGADKGCAVSIPTTSYCKGTILGEGLRREERRERPEVARR